MPVAVLLAFFGLAALAGGSAALVNAVRRRRHALVAARTYSAATGRITKRYVPPSGSTYSEGPSFTIDFTTNDGRAVQFITDTVGWIPHAVGTTVEVLYNPAAPEQAVVRGTRNAAFVPLVIAGIVFVPIGLLMLLSALDLALR